MPHFFRRAFPYIAIGLLFAALGWAMSFGTLPQADFTFQNGNEPETLDPALATGQPENRIINGLFEGLLRHTPPKDWQDQDRPGENVAMEAGPGMSTHFEESDDGRVYTFHIRPDAQWTDGSPVTSGDFAWSWRRMLHPETASKYAYQLHYVVGAKEYNLAQVEPGNHVEVELNDRKDPLQPFPRGTIVRGVLQSIHKPPEPQLTPSAGEKARADAEVDWKRSWIYAVEESAGAVRLFAKDPAAVKRDTLTPTIIAADLKIEKCLQVLPDFERTVGISAERPDKLVVTLNSRTPFFKDLVAFYPLYAVNRRCVETHGSPNWTKAENIVGNGAFELGFRRIRDRVRLVKNEAYWDAANVQLRSVDALAMKSETTAINMYLNGQLDWAPYLPVSTIPALKDPEGKFAGQFHSAPVLISYFFRVNVTRPELTDKRVRQALNLAIDKRAICERVLLAGEVPAPTYVPPGLAGYTSPPGQPYDVERAKALLAEAGYPGGRGLPTIEIMYNDLDKHRTIAETIQQMWRESLGIDVELRSLEWGVYLDSNHKLDYDVSRAGWVADYADPNTYLDMFVTGNENNQTGWSNARYDELIRQAGEEPDPAKRMSLLTEAETVLLDESPILPIYFYVSTNLVNPRVQGFFNTVQDEHPLKLLRVK
jgi:oligopeptide transport system substrate-binding protein